MCCPCSFLISFIIMLKPSDIHFCSLLSDQLTGKMYIPPRNSKEPRPPLTYPDLGKGNKGKGEQIFFDIMQIQNINVLESEIERK